MGRTVQFKQYRATPQEIARRKECALRAAVRLTKRQGRSGDPWLAVSQVGAVVGGSDPYLSRTLGLLVADGHLTMRGDRRFARYKVRAHALRAAA